MNEFWQAISNRDLSIALWFLILLVYVSFFNLNGTKRILESIFDKSFVILYILIIIYLGFFVFLLISKGFWENSYYKELLFWFFTSQFILLFNINKINRLRDFVVIILELFTFNSVLDYLINLESFSFIVEFFLVPIVVLFTFILQLSLYKSKTDNRYKKVTEFLNLIFLLLGFSVLIFTVLKIILDFNKFINLDNIKTFFVAPFLTIIYIPLLFLIVLYIKYEEAFINLNRYKFLNKKRLLKIKLSFIVLANINFKKINKMKRMIIFNKQQLKEEEGIFLFIKSNINNPL
ncbi:hypothetical protein [Empedobacter sp. GD03865]|uniref:hypothetical protein n=1 Tax=Empedobacter sp. GD03865 TaxID=2975392 RepID=UPI0024473D79|nr:hypothetical protein [Empedobacter sp. GD03865]MDH0659609.1 hypothetical protein [Empedobacter sp. GD03865]